MAKKTMTTVQALAELKLQAGASLEDLKKAYRKAALENHPDKGGDAEKFIIIQEAYEFLYEYGTIARQRYQIRWHVRYYGQSTVVNIHTSDTSDIRFYNIKWDTRTNT